MDSQEDLSHDHPAFLFRQPDVLAEVVEELSLPAELEHQEDVGRALEVLHQVDDVVMPTYKPAKTMHLHASLVTRTYSALCQIARASNG